MNCIVAADANVFLDGLLHRGEMAGDAMNIIELAEEKMILVYASSATMLNVSYFLKKAGKSSVEIITTFDNLLPYIKINSPDEKMFLNALHAGFTDLEDAVQYYTALNIRGIDYFITSNTKDYKKALPQLPVVTPKQFMALYKMRSR